MTSPRPCEGRHVALDARVEVRRPPAPPQFGGVATRAIALVTDAALIGLIGVSISAMATLIASLVGSLRPAWLVGLILAVGWSVLSVAYFAGFWSLVGQTPGMKLMRVRVRGPRGEPLSFARSVVRVVGLALAIIPCFRRVHPSAVRRTPPRVARSDRRNDGRGCRLRGVDDDQRHRNLVAFPRSIDGVLLEPFLVGGRANGHHELVGRELP